MKNTIQWLSFIMLFGLLAVACSDDKEEAAPESPLVGTWKISPTSGSLAVGPTLGDYSWWSISESDVTTRACLYDDTYVFNADGSFQNVVGASTWLESWQGVTTEGCGDPKAPHNGSVKGTWSATTSALTISGSGSYMGLAKVHNTGEDGSPDNNTIVYDYSLSSDKNTLTLTIQGWLPDVPDATWYFKFVRQ